MYLPKFRNINIDGAYFGTSFPHAFLKHYPEAIILPPKVFFYEPKIFGFKIKGKRGSKFHNPPQGTIKYIEESMNQIDREKLYKEVKEANKENSTAVTQKSPEKEPVKAAETAQPPRGRQQKPQNLFVQSEQVSLARESVGQHEDDEAQVLNEGKRKKKAKKNKKGGAKA